MAYNEEYMRLAIELAKKGVGGVNPNPLVGAVIVKDDRIIGQGYHAKYGELHAERSAFANLTEDAEGAEMYVTLEPCCHFGKQPPCTHAIVEHKIKKVYVGSNDPNEQVAGKGITYLRDNGIEVETEILKEECDKLNPVFFKYITTKLPYVVMKYAMTMDGKIAAYTGESKWITGEAARKNVQATRNWLPAIMVGIGTVLTDDPMLTCRIDGGRNPIRIVCDTKLRVPEDCNLVKTANNIKTIIAHGDIESLPDEDKNALENKISHLKDLGVRLIKTALKDNMLDMNDLMRKLGEEGIDGILLEGGGSLNYSALESGIVDEVQLYMAPKILGGRSAISPVEGLGFDHPDRAAMFMVKSIEQIEEDILIKYIKK